MKVHKITLYVVDFDHLGAAGVRDALECTRFANDCINPNVQTVETREIGEWDDSHPLNNRKTAAAEMERLFGRTGDAAT